ncbi:MAG: O-phosphoseryl-tRNA(Sec) selenium transferase [Promethearchaeota archaeon]
MSKEITESFYKIMKNTKIPENMLKRGLIGFSDTIKIIEDLFSQQKPPDNGLNDNQIKLLLEILASMDSNNDPNAFRIGEREARVSTSLLYEMTAGFIHGIGRSGDIKASQPKAAGGSILNYLTDQMVLYILRKLGIPNLKGAITVPLSTGMAIALTIRALYNFYIKKSNLEKIEFIFPRMDHKSPIKALNLAGVDYKIVETISGNEYLGKKDELNPKQVEFIEIHGKDAVYVPVEDIESAISEQTIGILSTTTFFPPRAPDNIKEIAKIAKNNNLIHIINNAYGVQSPMIMKMIRSAIDAGRVDAIIQSTDKNFLTPVGGAIIASPSQQNLVEIAKTYAGRGASAPILHLFISLLSMGVNGYLRYIELQQRNRALLEQQLKKIANKFHEELLEVNNPIACIMTMKNIPVEQLEKLGGYLYNLRVTGPRVLIPSKNSFGTSTANFPTPYIVMNAAIGATSEDIIGATTRLEKILMQIYSKIGI